MFPYTSLLSWTINTVIVFTLCVSSTSQAAITVSDDDGNPVTVQKPVRRLIAMAPHITEMLFAAGGGPYIVGAVSYSDYPEAAKTIPRIGDYHQIDMERVIAMKPDLIVAWRGSSSQRQIDMLRQLGIPVFYSEPKTLANIPESLLRLSQLMETENLARAVVAQLQKKLTMLRAIYTHRLPVRLFYQVWDKPLYTLNDTHIISDAIRLCGGENVFAGMKAIAPIVSIEAVLKEDPDAIVGSDDNRSGMDSWHRYPIMKAVRQHHIFSLNSHLLNRPGPRMIEGVAVLCEKLELVRRQNYVSSKQHQPQDSKDASKFDSKAPFP